MPSWLQATPTDSSLPPSTQRISSFGPLNRNHNDVYLHHDYYNRMVTAPVPPGLATTAELFEGQRVDKAEFIRVAPTY